MVGLLNTFLGGAKARFDVDSYEGSKSTCLCMEIAKASGPDFEGLISDPSNYGDKINHIEIPHVG